MRRHSLHSPLLGAVLLALLVGPLSGCYGMDRVLGKGEKVTKIYELPRKRTVVLVDSAPGQGRPNILALPGPRNIIAADMGYFLEKEEALDKGQVVPPKELLKVERELGADFATTPIDEIARRVGAQQVIHVLVEEARLRATGTLLQPYAEGQVKVLDIQTGRRTFPHPTALTQNGAGEPGHRMLVEMERLSAETVTSNEAEVFANKLAQEVALQVSRYFYDWRKPGFASQIQ